MNPREMTLGQLINNVVFHRHAVAYKNELQRRIEAEPSILDLIDKVYYAKEDNPNMTPWGEIPVDDDRYPVPPPQENTLPKMEEDLQGWLHQVVNVYGFDPATGMTREPDQARLNVKPAMRRGEKWEDLPEVAQRFYRKMEREFELDRLRNETR